MSEKAVFGLMVLMMSIVSFSFVPHAHSSSQALIYVSPSCLLVEVGENFTIAVNAEVAANFNMFVFQLRYNTSILDFLEVQVPVPSEWKYGYTINDTLGNIHVFGWSQTSTANGNFTLASITFKATSMGRSNLDLYDTRLLIESLEIQHTSLNGYMDTNLTLTMNVMTDKGLYCPEHFVQVYGSLNLDGLTVSDGLVALELDNPSSEPVLFRTLATGNITQEDCKVEILSVVPCDRFGTPTNTSVVGDLGVQIDCNVTVKNLSEEDLPLTITVTVYDVDHCPIDYTYIKFPYIVKGTIAWWKGQVGIPSTALNGTAMIYANVYSDFPRLNGTPYGSEKSASILLLSNHSSTDTTIPSQNTTGNYHTAFKLPLGEGLGLFTIHVNSEYKMRKTYNQTTFNATLLGDIDGSGKVEYTDVFLFGKAWWSQPGDPNWNPNADFDDSGKVDTGDLFIFGKNWMKTA